MGFFNKMILLQILRRACDVPFTVKACEAAARSASSAVLENGTGIGLNPSCVSVKKFNCLFGRGLTETPWELAQKRKVCLDCEGTSSDLCLKQSPMVDPSIDRRVATVSVCNTPNPTVASKSMKHALKDKASLVSREYDLVPQFDMRQCRQGSSLKRCKRFFTRSLNRSIILVKKQTGPSWQEFIWTYRLGWPRFSAYTHRGIAQSH